MSYTPCTVATKARVPSLRITVAAMPNISAKNITAIRSPLAAACTGLRGTILSRMSMPETASRPAAIWAARSPVWAMISWPSSGGMPRPGWNRLTMTRPMLTASVVTNRIQSRVLPPMRPSERGSPISTTPSTSAENTSGITSMNSRRRKTWPIGSATYLTSACSQAASANIRLDTRPRLTPTMKPMSMRVCSDSDGMGNPPAGTREAYTRLDGSHGASSSCARVCGRPTR